METFIYGSLICWLFVLIFEEFMMNYNAKKCGYNCTECKNWSCRKKTCGFKRGKKR